jgi:hypothetical protein
MLNYNIICIVSEIVAQGYKHFHNVGCIWEVTSHAAIQEIESFVKPEVSLPSLYEIAIDPKSKPDDCSHTHIRFLRYVYLYLLIYV